MPSYDELNSKFDKEILEFMSQRVLSNFTHNQDQNVGSRDLARAILDVRSTEVMQKHNEIMIHLTRVIVWLTVLLVILTGLLVYKEILDWLV